MLIKVTNILLILRKIDIEYIGKGAHMSLVIIGLVVIPVIIQYFVCKNSTGKIGLVLPILSFIISLIYTFSVGALDNVVYQIMIKVFLLMNVPTLILFYMYLELGRKT